jgi:3-dehydroquinate synthase
MPAIRIRSSAGAYEVHCARGTLARAGALTKRLGESSGIFLLSSPRVWKHWGKKLRAGFQGPRYRGAILFDDRESAKRLATVERLARALVRAGADRDAIVVAAGGGVVGDVAGFVAATYLRGVRLVHVPTTLLAQVDSSIGGKTGVNLPDGKNLVGVFYPPALVIADPEVLSTLPHREFRSGLYEVVKYGVIADRELFIYLCEQVPALLRRDPKALAWVIERSIRIKARVVGKDEREGGLRQVLNFGHTLGHALEAATDYRRFLHGEAIAWGMIAAALLGVVMDRMNEAEADRMIRLIASVGPLPLLRGVRAAELRSIIAADKKSREGRVRWVMTPKIGKAQAGIEVPWALVERVFADLPEFFAKAGGGVR